MRLPSRACFSLALIVLSTCLCPLVHATPFQQHYSIGKTYLEKQDFDMAIQEFNEALRLKPGDDTALIDRGTAFNEIDKYDKAIADFSKVIKGSRQSYLAYNNRGVSYLRKGLYDNALSDLDRAMKIEPVQPFAYLNAAGAALCAGKGGQTADKLNAWLSKSDWRDKLTMHGAILTAFCYRQARDNSAAEKLIKTGLSRGDKFAWPYPAIEYLSGKINKEKLMEAAEDSAYDFTQAKCFLALESILKKNDMKSARAHLDWVTKHGVRNSVEYWIGRGLLRNASNGQTQR